MDDDDEIDSSDSSDSSPPLTPTSSFISPSSPLSISATNLAALANNINNNQQNSTNNSINSSGETQASKSFAIKMVALSDVIKEGQLIKKGGGEGGRRNWTRRWFKLRADNLTYFKHKKVNNIFIFLVGLIYCFNRMQRQREPFPS